MNVIEKKALILKILNCKNYITSRDIFLTMCILFPNESEEFKSPMEIAQLILQIHEIKNTLTNPKLYFI